MHLSRFLLAAVGLTLLPFFSAGAQVDRKPVGETRTLELVDQLKDVIQKAEKTRTDPALMQQLRDLVRRYDWPWRVALLYDDFHDGDYTANPSWVVEVYDQSVNLEDGRPHGLEWRRGTDGEMVVLLDDKEIIRTSDRASGESFDGFTVINGGGDYAFSQIAIFGTPR